jgi:hypothetical protein
MSSIYQMYRAVFMRLEQLDFHQITVLVVVIVAFGCFCMRGFGSRTNY